MSEVIAQFYLGPGIPPGKYILVSDYDALRRELEAAKKGYADQAELRAKHEAGFVETIAQLQAQLATVTQERDAAREENERLRILLRDYRTLAGKICYAEPELSQYREMDQNAKTLLQEQP